MYGSAANGLLEEPRAGGGSDLDLTLISKGGELLQTVEEQRLLLVRVRKLLEKAHKLSTIVLQHLDEQDTATRSMQKPKIHVFGTNFGALLECKIKVLKADGQPMVIKVDILVDKVLEIMNTELIQLYCEQDHRFQKVALVLKAWNRDLSADKGCRLNSFSIYILLLAYMLFKHMLVNVQRAID